MRRSFEFGHLANSSPAGEERRRSRGAQEGGFPAPISRRTRARLVRKSERIAGNTRGTGGRLSAHQRVGEPRIPRMASRLTRPTALSVELERAKTGGPRGRTHDQRKVPGRRGVRYLTRDTEKNPWIPLARVLGGCGRAQGRGRPGDT